MKYHFNYYTRKYTDSNDSITPSPAPGDIIIVDLEYGLIELMTEYNPVCNECYFYKNNTCRAGSYNIHCSDNNVIFTKMDDYMIKIRDIKNRICNPDMCIYHDNLCSKGISNDKYNCLLRVIIRNENI